jgi:hypothetical protein
MSSPRRKTVQIVSAAQSRQSYRQPTPPDNSALPDIHNNSDTGSTLSKKTSGSNLLKDLNATPTKPKTPIITEDVEEVKIVPAEGIFNDVLPNTNYSMLFTVRNVSHKMLTVRIIPPALDAFTILHVPKKGIAPGLELTIKVLYFSKDELDFHDRFIILTDAQSIEVPLHAYHPAPEYCLPGSFDMGTLVPQHTATKYFELKNEGSREGNFQFSYDDSLPVYVVPRMGKIGSNSVQKIKVCRI